MANRERGELRLVTPDRTWTLRLTVEACCAVEDLAGRDLDAIIADANCGRTSELRLVLWAALQAHHADVFDVPEAASAVIDEMGGPLVVRPVVQELLALNANDEPIEPGRSIVTAETPTNRWRRIYLDARASGLNIEAFWALSLKELWLEMAVIRQRAKQARDADVMQAWYITNMVWNPKVQTLQAFLGTSESQGKPHEQTWQEMKAAFLSKMAGNMIVTKRPN